MMTMVGDEWKLEAACRGADPAPWFPGKGESALQAKVVCASCPVQVECAEYGIGMAEGVWGGLSNRERRTLRRERRRRSQL